MRSSGAALAALLALSVVLAAPASAGQEVRIKHQGLTLNGMLKTADGKTLADGLVLMVHGTLAHNAMDTMANLATVLSERGLTVLSINLSLGIDDRHGMYDCAVTHRHRHLDALDEITVWLDWLKRKGSGPVVLLGHSRGGNQAARFAAERGHPLLRNLVLMAPATWNEAAAAEAFERRHGRALAEPLLQARALVKAGRGDEVIPAAGLLYCPGANVTAASFASYYSSDPRFDTPSILPDIKLPTLVIIASDDAVVRNLAARVKPLADGKRLRFAVIDGAGHFFLDLFAEDIGDHIETLLAAGG